MNLVKYDLVKTKTRTLMNLIETKTKIRVLGSSM